ncbi:ABC transporter ATP-binding protein [uncultured Methanobrevibacter sp.]|uniref:ABC transporter ATP-binding protein n=1 Tax=uncultured Methanobrevibacter sp. TaxID=253161 RepID=UPI0026336334|nr:ABC transporter ATP-binding protein [uncultured Methanobrevibacter sp.]
MKNNHITSKKHTTKLNPQQKELVKKKLMDKYDITEEEAENVLLKLEKKQDNEKSNKTLRKSNNKIIKKTPETLKNTTKENPQQDKSPKNVDSIMAELIPDYNQQVSIELKNVDLTFEVDNEKVDTIKETFIRTIKRDNIKTFKIHALNNISFKIYKGEKVGIIGYNGAGKSTLLNVITGIYPPDKGSVKTNGRISPLLTLGAGFDHNYSGRKNIILNGAVLGYSKEFLETKIDEIIEFSELGDFIDIPIKNYSSGMLAKLGFSIATAVNPDILIIDEILGVGDVNFSKKSRDKIKSLMGGGTTVLFVSHSIPQVRELCDKAIWIDNGCVREIGEVNVVCDHYLKDAENASNAQLANIQFR